MEVTSADTGSDVGRRDHGRGALDPRTAAALAGPYQALEAARTVVAWANGFVGMELAGAFRLGGDVDAAFEYGVDRITRSIAGQ